MMERMYMEALDSSPANADNNAPVDTAQVDSEAVAAEGAAPATAAADTGKPELPERDKVQERIDKLTREKYGAFGERDSERYRREQLEREIAELRQQQAKPATVAPSTDYPTLESCGFDETKHATAVAAWITKQTAETTKALRAAEREAEQREQLQKGWERRQAEFIKSKPEYVEKVGSLPPSLMTDQLSDVIMDSPIGPEVALYLAENLEKLEAISQLPQKSQAREIGRIEARLEAAKAAPPPVSKAPAPAPTITATEATTEKDPSAMSDAEFAKWRGRQIAQRR
jgi:hypothetical protein